jgi:hypothetical protein
MAGIYQRLKFPIGFFSSIPHGANIPIGIERVCQAFWMKLPKRSYNCVPWTVRQIMYNPDHNVPFGTLFYGNSCYWKCENK